MIELYTLSLHDALPICCATGAELRFARLRLGVVGVGGCTAKSGCATKSRGRIGFVEAGGAAGPGPVLGMSGQSCLDGIVLDVGADGVELFGRADPIVEG